MEDSGKNEAQSRGQSIKSKTESINFWQTLTPEKARELMLKGIANEFGNSGMASWAEELKKEFDSEADPDTQRRAESLLKKTNIFYEPKVVAKDLAQKEASNQDPLDEARLAAGQLIEQFEQKALDLVNESDKQKTKKDPLSLLFDQIGTDLQSLKPSCQTDDQNEIFEFLERGFNRTKTFFDNLREFSNGKIVIPFNKGLNRLEFDQEA